MFGLKKFSTKTFLQISYFFLVQKVFRIPNNVSKGSKVHCVTNKCQTQPPIAHKCQMQPPIAHHIPPYVRIPPPLICTHLRGPLTSMCMVASVPDPFIGLFTICLRLVLPTSLQELQCIKKDVILPEV